VRARSWTSRLVTALVTTAPVRSWTGWCTSAMLVRRATSRPAASASLRSSLSSRWRAYRSGRRPRCVAATRRGASADRLVVAAGQDLRDRPIAEHRWAGVLRVLEQPGGERLVVGRRGVAEHARHEPRDRVDHARRAELAAGQHEVAERDLLVDARVEHALIDALVAAAHQHDVIERRQAAHGRLGQRRAAGAEEDAVRRGRRRRWRRPAARSASPCRGRRRRACRRRSGGDRG
jgi:hypothetical protein